MTQRPRPSVKNPLAYARGSVLDSDVDGRAGFVAAVAKTPASLVRRVSSATDGTASLVVIAVRCSFTVRSWMPRSAAICLLSLPLTT